MKKNNSNKELQNFWNKIKRDNTVFYNLQTETANQADRRYFPIILIRTIRFKYSAHPVLVCLKDHFQAGRANSHLVALIAMIVTITGLTFI